MTKMQTRKITNLPPTAEPVEIDTLYLQIHTLRKEYVHLTAIYRVLLFLALLVGVMTVSRQPQEKTERPVISEIQAPKQTLPDTPPPEVFFYPD